jgi:ribosomal protein S4
MKNTKKKNFGIDFFKTILGQHLLLAHYRKRRNWFRKYNHLTLKTNYAWNNLVLNNRVKARRLQASLKRAWIYTNYVFPKQLPYYFQQSTVNKVFPYNKFQPHWSQLIEFPWLAELTSKRNLYSGFLASNRRQFKWTQKFSWIPALRNKLDWKQKKAKLYFYRQRLLFNRDNRLIIRSDKKKRIQQVLTKSTLPFYGHLTLNQFDRIKKKTKRTKSSYLACDEVTLSTLERRLDVIVYRLNLAPNILWARKLIQDGSIFVSPSGVNKAKNFEKMYANFKLNSYPLKLRDPQNLYKKTFWQNNKKNSRQTKLKFLLEPLRNINYLTQPGDVILCAPGALQNKYKTSSILWQKPIPTHLLSYSHITETKNSFKSRYNTIKQFARKSQTSTTVGIVMHNPKFSDLHTHDRIQKTFLRWMAL